MIEYKIYANTGIGDDINYSSPIGTTSLLTFSPPALGLSEDWKFAVRAYDTVSGLEELNIDASVRVVTDPSGADVTGRPNPPTGLAVVAAAGGSARVSWAYNPGGQGGPPSAFVITVGGVDTLTVPYVSGLTTCSATLTGLADGVSCTIGVRSTNGSGGSATVAAAVTARTTGPAAVEGLAGAATA
jgi:hypothetical protein